MGQREERLAVIRSAYAARDGGDAEGLVTAFHPEGLFTLMGDKSALALTGSMQGHPTLRGAFSRLIDEFGFEGREILAELVDGGPPRRSIPPDRAGFKHRDPGSVQI